MILTVYLTKSFRPRGVGYWLLWLVTKAKLAYQTAIHVGRKHQRQACVAFSLYMLLIRCDCLVVSTPPPIIKPSPVIRPLPSLYCKRKSLGRPGYETSAVTLLAVVTMKDGLLSGYRYTVQADGGVGTLTIRDARLLDGAEYTCQVASTLHGSSLAQRSTRLIVEDSELCLLQP